VGENKHQEAEAKAAECAGLGLRWHFIGNLQSNKAAAVAAYADVVESVDRRKLLAGLSRGAHQRGGVLDCLVQVNLDPDTGGDSGRGGAAPADVVPLAEQLAAAEGLRLRGVIGAAHAGRPGLVAGVGPATVAAMRELGAEQICAWVGPHVCGSCYEVPAQMRADVAAVVPEAQAETSWGTPSRDVGAGVVAQLRAAGVDVVDASRCTREDDDLYSDRRQGTESGRLAGLVRVRP
jgi:hypothetical protein